MRLIDGFSKAKNNAFINSDKYLDLPALRKVFIIFVVLYGFFAVTDLLYFPDFWVYLWILRFGVVIPVLISTFFLTYHKNFIRFYQPYITFSFVLGGIVIAVMLILQPDNMVYYGGLFMIYFSGYLLVKLRYIYALIGGWTIFLFHLIGTLIYYQSLPEIFLYSGLFFIGANIIGMVGAYNNEKAQRKQFLRDSEIESINLTLNEQNDKIKLQLNQLQEFIKENQDLSNRYAKIEELTSKLKATEERFEELSSQARTFFYETNLEGLYTYVSNSVEAILGYTKDEIIGNKYFYDLFPEIVREKYQEIGLEKLQSGNIVNNFINPIETKDGKTIWVNSHLRPVRNNQDEIIGYRGSDKDITEEIKAKEDLQLFKTITEQSKYGSAISTLDGTLIYVNEAFCEMHGYAKEELLNKPIKILHNEEQLELVRDLLGKMLEKGGYPAQEVWHQKKNGEVFPTIMTGKTIYNDDQEPIYFSTTMFDITKEKQVEMDLVQTKKELEESRNNLQTIMDNLPIGIAVNSANPEVNFSYINDHFLTIYDVLREDLEKEDNFWNAVYEDEIFRENIRECVLSDIASGDISKMKWQDVPIVRKGKPTRYITAQNTPIPNANLVVSTVMDVTERKTKEDEIRYVSNHDYLTKIPNRRYYQEQLTRYDQESYYPLSIVLMDLNGLKLINDAFGHSVGNEALKKIANALEKSKRKNDFVARIGGDEFAMICPNTDKQSIADIVHDLQEKISVISIENIKLSMAIGYYVKENKHKNIRTVLRLAEDNMYRNKVLSSHSLKNDAIASILQTLQAKFNEEKVHSERVSRFCKLIGEAMNLRKEEIKELEIAGLYHDIGKISIPDAILDKPGKLTAKEWETMKNHTINGYQILRAADRYSNLAEYAMSHHERIDGKGYPNGIKGEDIPLFSRIISVADAFEAMTSDRPYRKAIKKAEAIEELKAHAGTQFDEEIVDLFIHKVLTKHG